MSWEGSSHYLEELAGTLIDMVRRALVTWRCWARKDWPGGTRELAHPLKRDSIASLWKCRLCTEWICALERKFKYQVQEYIYSIYTDLVIRDFTLLYHAVTISFSSYSFSLACSHSRCGRQRYKRDVAQEQGKTTTLSGQDFHGNQHNCHDTV